MKRWLSLLALCCLTGCYSDDKPKLSQAHKDKQALDFYAALVNASQTNWTVIITNR